MHRSQLTLFKKILWVVYLAIALVFIQGARLHVHIYSHDQATPDHAHQAQAHFEFSEKVHPDEMGQLDLSQQGLLKNLSFGSLIIALFVSVIVILSPRLCTQVPWRLNRRAPLVSWPFSLRPPLRAPPL